MKQVRPELDAGYDLAQMKGALLRAVSADNLYEIIASRRAGACVDVDVPQGVENR